MFISIEGMNLNTGCQAVCELEETVEHNDEEVFVGWPFHELMVIGNKEKGFGSKFHKGIVGINAMIERFYNLDDVKSDKLILTNGWFTSLYAYTLGEVDHVLDTAEKHIFKPDLEILLIDKGEETDDSDVSFYVNENSTPEEVEELKLMKKRLMKNYRENDDCKRRTVLIDQTTEKYDILHMLNREIERFLENAKEHKCL